MIVTLAFAQSLDGCITVRPGHPTALSCAEAMAYTHRLRAAHDAILVGVDTVLADDPRLSVRLVEGRSPQPIVLDSNLRMPLACRLVTQPVHPLWVLCSRFARADRQHELEAHGVRVLRAFDEGPYLARWPQMLDVLVAQGVGSLMVEGGSRVITSLLESGCAHRLSLTIAPRMLAGLHAVHQTRLSLPELHNVRYRPVGSDLVVEADFR